MNNNNLKGISYTSAFFILIGLAVLGLMISGTITSLAIIYVTDGNIENVKQAFKDPRNADLVRLLQAISVFVSMFVPAYITARMIGRKPFQVLGFNSNIDLKQGVVVFLMVLMALFIAGALGFLNKQIPIPADWQLKFEKMEQAYLEQVAIMVNFKSFGGYLMSIFLLGLLPALFEEALFRGGLQNFLTRATNKPWISILIVSIIFSLVHFSFYGFLPRVFLGIMLGIIFYVTNNLWLPVLAHFLNNAMAITQAYFLSLEGKNIKDVMNEDMPTSYWGFLAIPFFYMLYRVLKNNSGKPRSFYQTDAT